MKTTLSAVLFVLVAACGEKKSPVVKSEPVPVTMEDEKKSEPGFGTGEEMPKPIKTTEPVVEIALPKTYDDALAMGKELVTKGEHPRAREILQLAAKLDKKKPEPHIELARSYIATNERANAIKSAKKAVKLAPESSQAYNTLGRAELTRHNYENAIEAFRQATELNADNVWAWNNLGFTYLTLKKYDDAVTALVEATSHKGTEAYMWNNLGTAYEHLDQLDDARDAFEKGGEMGSVAAASSRKRLEGVDTIVIVKAEPKAESKDEPSVETFEHEEPMPDEPPAIDEEPKSEESGVDAKVEDVDSDHEEKPEATSQVEDEEVDDEFKGDETL